jgi:signal transduction histidine kinase
MAIPMVSGEQLVGVLDVQANVINRFTDEDVLIKTTLADQIAVAVQNARTFETEREAAERLREVDRLKSQFLANMSHELRTPLNSIIGYAEVLLDGIDGDLSDEATMDVQDIHNSGKHLLAIINDILDLAKIEAGQMKMDAQVVSLQEIVEDVAHSAQILVKEKAVDLQVVAEASPIMVQGDPIRLRQVVLNLVSNAVKFTETGSVTIEVVRASNTDAAVKVIDTGIGMSEDGLAVIFERFSQVDGSATRRSDGTGLGLTITRELIQMHGGDIYAESEEGVGSTFWFSLPIAVPEVAGE